LVLLAWGSNLQAAVIDVGTHDIGANTNSFVIPIMVTTNTAETVTDMVLRAQVEDGGTEFGGSEDGPAIVGIDYTGTVWEATNFNASFSPGLAVGDFRQLVQSDVSIDFATGVPVAANGVLVNVVVDVTGLPVGRSYALNLTGTLAGDSTFLGLPSPQINNGTITIVPIPEPSSAWLLLLTVGLALSRGAKRATARL